MSAARQEPMSVSAASIGCQSRMSASSPASTAEPSAAMRVPSSAGMTERDDGPSDEPPDEPSPEGAAEWMADVALPPGLEVPLAVFDEEVLDAPTLEGDGLLELLQLPP